MSSQEQRPIRSRRELRRAREEQEQAVQAPVQDAGQPPGQLAPPAGPPSEGNGGGVQSQGNGGGVQSQGNGRNRRAADGPVDAVASGAQERSSQIRARDRAALRTIKELAQASQTQSKETSATPTPDSPSGDEMSVEQALAVRELIAAQVQNQTAKLEHIAEQDPLAVDPVVLAQQIALAERAAVLNKRAAAKQKLAEQALPEKPEPKSGPGAASGPSTANNLAMVTPLEFVKVPGVERPVMKRPSTTFVPLVTSANPKAGASTQAEGRGGRGRAGVLARAEAVARNARKRNAAVVQDQEAERPPVSASTAYGLDPLDANTAGLARAQRNKLMQYGVLALGVIALIVGIIMITSG